MAATNKKNDKRQMFDKGKEYTDVVRYPVKLHVDEIEFDPTDDIDIVRTAYDLDLTPSDVQKLHDWLHKKLESDPYAPVRIRVIGELVS